MNDAGTDIHEHEVSQHEADDRAHLGPSRWWFASSAFPMIAGTLGPVASAFSICALVKPWRQSYPPGTNIDSAPFIPDPPWLTAINAVQLVIAILANMALLLNMTRRLSFTIAQPVTIVGWYVSSFALVSLTATAAGPLVIQPSDQFVWSQAFYYGIYSAVLYFLVASLMVVTYMGAHAGRYPKDFMLTPSQRTLMLQTIMFLLYLLLGALLFSKLEGWTYLDGVYWAAVTLFTVGFGDFYATKGVSRGLLIPYSLIGIISLGLVIGSIRSLVLDRGKRRVGARMVEKGRRRTLRRLTQKGRDDILMPIRDDPPTMSSGRTDSLGLTEFERRELEFKLMRKIQDTAAHRRRWIALCVSTSSWLLLWLVGAKVFQRCEAPYQGWSYFDGVYFAFVSLTTIGYGDITPVSNAGKSFWVFWALLALPTTTVLISDAGDTVIKGIRDATDQIATVTILPSEHGFKRDFRRLLRTLSCGALFDEDENVEEEPPGLLGHAAHFKLGVTDGNDNDHDDPGETMQQDEADIEAEGANTAHTKQKRAEREQSEQGHSKRVEANAADETNTSRLNHNPSRNPDPNPNPTNNRITFSYPSSPSTSHQQRPLSSSRSRSKSSRSRSRSHSIPRQHLPSIPTNKHDYHVTLIDEIRRVAQHLKHHPPRKYSFHEWAWYLRLIGEDEADAERHRKANPHVKTKKGRLVAGRVPDDKGLGQGDGQGEGGNMGKEEKEEPQPWSWVGSRSPLMGSQEEAEWILERLIARLGEELRAARDGKFQEGEK
ncbi:outward-rectifier potassium channel TOK1 [Achaetomium macrosporum]|uniref:Outward-rectifier potassium channel TOK1 n=1 Tax=Achaetomium macrosporum TaxID=79813 RepID=A0AAN7CG98_9PEZI|nr:outward-rectifier potassium channel TOK1 [Achaetomium macrosporum]